MKRLLPWIKGFLSAYGMRAVIDTALRPEWFAEKTEYYTESVYQLLGYYDFVFLLLWIVCSVFFIYMSGQKQVKDAGVCILSIVFAILVPVGQVLRDLGTVSPLFGSFVNLVKTILIVAGLFFFFMEAISWLTAFLQKKNFLTNNVGFFERGSFWKCFVILETVYLLAVLINFPGNMCYDTEGQMMQVLGEKAYSTHHPLVSTLLFGLPVLFGVKVLGSKVAGIFIYMLIQTAMLSTSLSFTVYVMSKKGIDRIILWIMTAIYAISPVYSNIASTAVKDVPFISAFVAYFVVLVLVNDDAEGLKNKRLFVLLVVFGMLTCLFRKNGYYVIVLTGIIWCILKLKELGIKEVIKASLGIFLLGTILAYIIDSSLAAVLHAEKGSAGEAFSLPFQITARYINEHFDELTDREITAISGVLDGDPEKIAGRYNPELADAVKALYITDASGKDIAEYVKVWVAMFFKHPGTYIDGFLAHTYGWYCPNVSTATRYETGEDDFLELHGIFAVTDKIMIFIYRFADRISLLGVLQNAGFAVWGFWYLTYLQRKNKKLRQCGIPLWVSFMICITAPGFMEHTRYAFPILMTMPFFFAYTLTGSEKETINEKA